MPDDLDPFVDVTPTRRSEEFAERRTTSYTTSSNSMTVFVSVPPTGSVYTPPTTNASSFPSNYAAVYDTEPKHATSVYADIAYTEYSESHNVTPAPSSSANSYPLPLPTYSHAYSSFSSNSEPPTQKEGITTEGEIVCEPGFKWNPEKQLCLHTLARCPKNMYLSVSLNKCLPKVGDKFNCPSGYEFRNDMNGCEGE